MANEKSHTDKFEELCAGYVLHSLNEDERNEFEQMLEEATDEERQLYESLASAANQLAFTVEKAEPSDEIKKRLMAEIKSHDDDQENEISGSIHKDQTSPEDKNKGEDSFNWQAFAIAASFALLIVSLSLVFYSFNLRSQVSHQKTQIVRLKNELQQKRQMLSILGSRDVDMVIMAGMEVNPNGYGKVIWDPKKQQALLQVSNLPPVPKGKDYQLWLIKNNKPVSAGVFATDNEGDNFFKIEKMAQASKKTANAFAVTLEPKGGVPQPTGDMYLMGSMKNNSSE
ncbi:MAG TPA: anti-sigma factor [Balneolaceae bacterium]|nr:anti-sigma factor [Balneolaceae bacterium]